MGAHISISSHPLGLHLGSLGPKDGPVFICSVMLMKSLLCSHLPSHPCSFPLAPLGCLDFSPSSWRTAVDEALLSPVTPTIYCRKGPVSKAPGSGTVRTARLVSENPALFPLVNSSFKDLFGQKQVFLLLRGCMFGRVQRNQNPVSFPKETSILGGP